MDTELRKPLYWSRNWVAVPWQTCQIYHQPSKLEGDGDPAMCHVNGNLLYVLVALVTTSHYCVAISSRGRDGPGPFAFPLDD
jgi:hypothetical protein